MQTTTQKPAWQQPKHVLLIVDPQKGFTTTEQHQTTLKHIVSYMKHVKKSHKTDGYTHYIATQFINMSNSPWYDMGYQKMVTPTDQAIYGEIKSVVGNNILQKTSYSAVTNQTLRRLEDIIEGPLNTGLVSVDVIGFDTDGCVMATVFSLWDLGIIPRVISGLCYSGNSEAHKAALMCLKRSIGGHNVLDEPNCCVHYRDYTDYGLTDLAVDVKTKG